MAIQYFDKIIEIILQKASPVLLAKVYNNLGVAYEELGDMDRGLEYKEKALAICKEKQIDREIINIVYANVAWSYFFMKEYRNAYYYMKKIDVVNEKILESLDIISARFYELRYGCHCRAKDYKKYIMVELNCFFVKCY